MCPKARATVNKTREARLRAGPHLADEAASDQCPLSTKVLPHWRLALGTPPPWAGRGPVQLPSCGRANETPERTGPEAQLGPGPLGFVCRSAPSHPQRPSQIQGHCRKAWWFVCSRPMPSKSKEASPHLAPDHDSPGHKGLGGVLLYSCKTNRSQPSEATGARHA